VLHSPLKTNIVPSNEKGWVICPVIKHHLLGRATPTLNQHTLCDAQGHLLQQQFHLLVTFS
jgi:hypothetical protein